MRFTFTTTKEKAEHAQAVRASMPIELPQATFVRSMFESGLALQAKAKKGRE